MHRKRQRREEAPSNAEPDKVPSLQPGGFNAAIKFKNTLGKELMLSSDVCATITLISGAAIPKFLLHFSLNHIYRFSCQSYTTASPEACVGCDTKFSPWIVKSWEEIRTVTAVEDITELRIEAWVQIFEYRAVVTPFLFDGHYSVFVLEGMGKLWSYVKEVISAALESEGNGWLEEDDLSDLELKRVCSRFLREKNGDPRQIFHIDSRL